MKKSKSRLISLILIFCILFSEFSGELGYHVNPNTKSSGINGLENHLFTGNYLFVNNLTSNKYIFSAKGECYILVDVDNTDFSFFYLDGEKYDVSYGFNALRRRFSNPMASDDELSNHTLEIDPSELQYFKYVCVEPIYLAQGNVNVTLNETNEIDFKAGGVISILVQHSFPYNWLYLQLDGVILKEIYNTSDYPEIDSALYAALIEGGSYIRFDIDVDPGDHSLKLKGNGTLNYKIVTNLDFDRDKISDADEVLQEDLYDIDPLVPDIWGLFERSGGVTSFLPDEIASINASSEGHFSFNIPQCDCPHPTPKYFYIDVFNGEFSEFEIDGDHNLLKNITLSADYPNTSIATQFVKELEPGWHYIKYKYNSSEYHNISFRINAEKIKVIEHPELRDTDADGVKDLEELSNGLNIYDGDSDGDNIPDNLDISPLSALSLDKDKINQFIFPANNENNTIINLLIRKPTTDYSCHSRIWRNQLNVSIFPAIRLYGNSTITRQQMEDDWGKVFETYSLINESNESSIHDVGDSLPGPDPDVEFTVIISKPSETSCEFDITFPKGHPAKEDGIIDLRFDFVWLVTYVNETSETKEPLILHIYDIEEDILLQAMVKREISNVSYILATPDSMIENYLLWTLVQNPTLGTPDDFNMSADIIGQDTVDYLNLANQTLQDRQETPRNDFDTEVLYVSGFQSNYDILNKINIKNVDADFETVHSGDFEAFFSFYSITNVYEEYVVGDHEIQGESKIIYHTFHYNFTTTLERRANVLGLPLSMELLNFESSRVLKITRAIGSRLPIAEIPFSTDSRLHDNLKLWHQTFIEPIEDVGEQIPLLKFNNSIHIYKEFFDNRQDEVNVSALFFTHHSPMPAANFLKMVQDYIELLEYQINNINEFLDLVPSIRGRALLRRANEELQEFYDAMEPEDFEINFKTLFYFKKRIEAITKWHGAPGTKSIGRKMFWKSINQMQKSPKWNTIIGDKLLAFDEMHSGSIKVDTQGEELRRKLDNEWRARQTSDPAKCNPACGSGMEEGTSTEKTMSKLKGMVTGSVSIAIGVLSIYFGILELYHLLSNSGAFEGRELEFLLRMGGALAITALGVCAFTMGLVIYADTFGWIAADAAVRATTSLGKAVIVLAILFIIFEVATLLTQWQTGEVSEIAFKTGILQLVVTLAIALGVPLAVSAATSSTGPWGAVAAGIIMLISVITAWITTRINDPNINITSSQFIFPEENIRRRGSLTVGDQVSLELNIENTGDRNMWLLSRFAVSGAEIPSGGSPDWTPYEGRWADGQVGLAAIPLFDTYCPGDTDTLYMMLNLTRPIPDTHLHNSVLIDAEIVNIIILPYFERVEVTRDTTSIPLHIPVCDRSIADFFDDTEEFVDLEQAFHDAVKEFRYKDAIEAANLSIASIEAAAEMSIEEYHSWVQALQEHNDTHYIYQASSEDHFAGLITRYYEDGFRATNPIPIQGPLMEAIAAALDQDELGLLVNTDAFDDSGGQIFVPKSWIIAKGEELAAAFNYTSLVGELPCRSNIKLAVSEFTIDIEPLANTTINFDVILDGPDDPVVDVKILVPEGFVVTPDQCSQYLSSDITFNLTTETPYFYGMYYFGIEIYRDGALVFNRSNIPVRVRSLSDLRFNSYRTLFPITPGQSFATVRLVNFGNIPEILTFTVEGIPANFINKTFHPGDFIDDFTQQFVLSPGDVRDCLIMTPPRHYTTVPQQYTYNVMVRDQATDELYYSYTDSFIVGVFHELQVNSVQAHSANRPGTPSTLSCEVTNWGNAPESIQFNLDVAGWSPSTFSSPTSVIVNPSETKSVDLAIDVARDPLLTPKYYQLTIEMCSDAGVLATVHSTLEILEFHDVDLEVEDASLTDGVPEEIEIKASNIGNVEDQFTFEVDHFGTSIQGIQIVNDPTVTLNPAESRVLRVRIDPYELGTEVARISAFFLDWNAEPVSKREKFNVTILDDDTNAPIIVLKYADDFRDYWYYQSYDPSDQVFVGPNTGNDIASNEFFNISGDYYKDHAEYQKFWFLIHDPSGVDQMNLTKGGFPIDSNLTWNNRLIYPLSTQNTYEWFYARIPSIKMDFGVNVWRELLYASEDEEHAGYLSLTSRFRWTGFIIPIIELLFPRIVSVEVKFDGQTWTPSSSELNQEKTTFKARYPIPRVAGIHEFQIHIQYLQYYFHPIFHHLIPYLSDYVRNHTVYVANCPRGEFQIPLEGGFHNYTLSVRDGDCDNGREHDKLNKTLSWSVQIVQPYGVNMSVTPLILSIYDDELAIYQINITNLGSFNDTFQITLHDLTLGTAILSETEITLPARGVTTVTLTIHPLHLGSEIFTILVESLGGAEFGINATLHPMLIVLDDDVIPPDVTITYMGSETDGNPGYWEVTAFDASGLIQDPSGIYPLSPELGSQTLTVTAQDADADLFWDALTTTVSDTVTIIDDDITPPEIKPLAIGVSAHYITIEAEIIDPSGIGAVTILVDGAQAVPLSHVQDGNFHTIILHNAWIMEYGMHSLDLTVWDADDDRVADALSTTIESTFEILLEEMKQFVLWEIDQLSEDVQNSPDECWAAINRKMTMSNKLDELKAQISAVAFEDAYDKLLHDIKPKLTGLKTDETETPWGNGVFNNPWVTCSDLQDAFRVPCNDILTHITILINSS